jgi:hypothetical protein
MIQYGHVLHGRYLRFSFVCRQHIKPEISAFQSVSFFLYLCSIRLLFLPLHLDKFLSATQAQRLEIHYTPKHGSWLDIAEVELSALASQCLGERRISSIEALNKVIAAWGVRRNTAQKGVDWHFTTIEARIKLKRLYPNIL